MESLEIEFIERDLAQPRLLLSQEKRKGIGPSDEQVDIPAKAHGVSRLLSLGVRKVRKSELINSLNGLR